jgi:hypothetical protein
LHGGVLIDSEITETGGPSGECFKEQDKGSFFGDFLYGRIVPENHFLRQLDALIPWQRFIKRLVQFNRGKARLVGVIVQHPHSKKLSSTKNLNLNNEE